MSDRDRNERALAVPSAEAPSADVRELLERMTDGFIALDREGRCAFINEPGALLLGRPAAELIGTEIWEEFPAGQPFRLAAERALREQERVALDERYAPWDRWFRLLIYPSPTGVTIFFRDITEAKRSELQLRISEARLRALLDAVPEGIVIVEPNRGIAYGNATALALVGQPGSPLASDWTVRHADGSVAAVSERPVARALAGEAVVRMEQWIERGEDRRVIESSAAPIRDDSGNVVAAAVFFQDVTARMHALREVKVREAFLQSVLSSAQEGILVFDRALRCTYVNEGALRMSGRTADTILGRSIPELTDAPRRAAAERALAGEEVPTTIVIVTTPAGDLTLSGAVTALREPEGEIAGVLLTLRDLTSEVAAQRALQAERELATQVVESTQDLVAVFDRELRIVLWNAAAARVTGRPAGAVLGQHLLEVFPFMAGTPVRRIERAFAGEVVRVDRPELVLPPGGTPSWFTGSCVPLRDQSGAVTRVLLTRQDVTAREEALERERQSETLAALGRLVGGVAHEIRNPLFGVSATLDAFEAKVGDLEDNRVFLQRMRKELLVMRTLVDELLDYGRPAPPMLALGSVRACVEEAMGATVALARSRAVDVRLMVAADVADALIDAARLPRLFVNVIDNAIRFAPEKSGVEISIGSATSGSVRVTVEDRGPGFPPEDLEKVFEPFFSRRAGGTGLGLAIAARIAAQHEATLTASNRPGGGASVCVLLPAMEGAPP